MNKQIRIVFNETQKIKFLISKKEDLKINFEDKIILGSGGFDEYKGEYEVTPKIAEQTLLTKNKILKENVKIKSIPYYETSNVSGGNTIYIG